MTDRPENSRQLDEAASYASDVGVLGALQVLTRLRGLILLPVIARVLGTGAYGVWSQSLVAVTLGSSLVDLQLHSAVVRYVAGARGRSEQRNYFAPLLVIVAGLGAIMAVFIALVPEPVAVHVLGDPGYTGVAGLLGVWIALAAVGKFGLHMLRGLQRVKLYGLLDTLHTLLQLAVVAVVVLIWRDLLLAVKAAIALEAGFSVLVVCLGFRSVGLGWPGLGGLRPALRYSLPLVPSHYAAAALAFSDRLAIASQLGAEAVGVYAAAYSMARVVREIFGPILTALLPTVSKVWDRGDYSQGRWLLSNTMRYYLLLALPALVGVASVGSRVLSLLAPEAVSPATTWLISFLGLGLLFNSLQSIFSILLQLLKETGALAMSRLISAGSYLLLIAFIVPKWGLLGGAVATAVGYGLDLLITSRMAWRREGFDIPVQPAREALLACGGMLLAVHFALRLHPLWGVVLAIIVGVSVYMTLVLIQGSLGGRDLRFLLRAIGVGEEGSETEAS